MANELQSLSLIFQNRLFRIPDYQRGYAWKQSQLIDFWDDLINLSDDRYHYTGLLSLKNLSKKDITSWGNDIWLIESGYKANHIVDGQQRLTTFVILLNEILTFVKSLDENKDKTDDEIVIGYDTLKNIYQKYICRHRPPNNQISTYLFGYETDNPSAEYLRFKIFNEANPGTINETYYTKNLKFAKQFFNENLTKLCNEEGVQGITDIYSKLTQKLLFNIHEIDDDYDVFVAFETMNNRGKKLTNLELLKNRLIYLTTLYSEPKFDSYEKSNLRGLINDAWKEVYFQLGRNENTPLSDNDFLRAHWTIYFSYSRKKGDDYIIFLLNKFSAKNIFTKKPIILTENSSDSLSENYEDNEETDINDEELIEVLQLEPYEISSYVNSLKDIAKYWYYSFFPNESSELTNDEKIWVDKLNRIGIGHFRPLVTVILSRQDLNPTEKITAFKAIERFIFICFRIGGFQSSFGSSDFYRASRNLNLNTTSLNDIVDDIVAKTDRNIEYSIPNFVSSISKKFANGQGYFGWNSIKYFMYEYEQSLSIKNNLDKLNWSIFVKNETDKVSIEHILPQTPTKYYWRNEFRQFEDDEIETLSGALGNLLPLSQSINSSLQNDGFHDKKSSGNNRIRGYDNGSHSEIEVSKFQDWTAINIYERSKKLLLFMEKRWELSFTKEQLEDLIFIKFVNDGRFIPPEVVDSHTIELNESRELLGQRFDFWTKFNAFCNAEGKDSYIGNKKPSLSNWYSISLGTSRLHIEFSILKSNMLSIIIYAETFEVFKELESKKEEIELLFGDKFDWYSSREKSNAKRIIFKRDAEIFNPEKQPELFSWMIDKFEKLLVALVHIGEVDKDYLPNSNSSKFNPFIKYLQNANTSKISLSFSDIEDILGFNLAQSAYKYSAYWSPSKTHILPNLIIENRYKIKHVDIESQNIILEIIT